MSPVRSGPAEIRGAHVRPAGRQRATPPPAGPVCSVSARPHIGGAGRGDAGLAPVGLGAVRPGPGRSNRSRDSRNRGARFAAGSGCGPHRSRRRRQALPPAGQHRLQGRLRGARQQAEGYADEAGRRERGRPRPVRRRLVPVDGYRRGVVQPARPHPPQLLRRVRIHRRRHRAVSAQHYQAQHPELGRHHAWPLQPAAPPVSRRRPGWRRATCGRWPPGPRPAPACPP